MVRDGGKSWLYRESMECLLSTAVALTERCVGSCFHWALARILFFVSKAKWG